MIYQCVKDFEIPVINENGMMTESVFKGYKWYVFQRS